MPLPGTAKKRLGVRLGSAATSGEGTQNLLCAYLAVAVLVGNDGQRAVGVVAAGPRRRAGHRALAV
jgi:hypothetical protein